MHWFFALKNPENRKKLLITDYIIKLKIILCNLPHKEQIFFNLKEKKTLKSSFCNKYCLLERAQAFNGSWFKICLVDWVPELTQGSESWPKPVYA